MQVTTRIKSALRSKINWTQAIGIAAQVVAFFGLDVPADIQAEIVVMIGSGQAIATWILRTWFTTSITAASAARMGRGG
ncbi:hypothetical protein [Jannaschia sp. M317]|uniref:hypothetical protein n=1 Tax=Jannaschia sp. M317 TaxID=2867011 RepID=UPI0021A82186|nr:hypothetical protein [Jannaschia sp. M317]UWQ16165.1 hypothetical protein K3551_09460 [Jannaschia sp. M317]